MHRMIWRCGPVAGVRSLARAAALAVATGLMLSAPASAQTPWRFAGADINDSHAVLSPPGPYQLNPSTVPNMRVKWVLNTVGDVSVTPTVEAGALYVTDWAGQIYRINPDTGAIVWQLAAGLFANNDWLNTYSRTSPAIGDLGEIVLGLSSTQGGMVVALDKTNGHLLWKTIVNANPATHILASPVIYNHKIYIGTASGEEDKTSGITFRGQMLALDEATGKIDWSFLTVPPGYTGGPVPGSNPVVDPKLNSIYFGTGNNYTIPADVAACVISKGTNRDAQLGCMDPTNFVDSVISLDLDTGALRWGRRMLGSDVWTTACDYNLPTCAKPRGPDSDFASAPNLFWNPGLTGRVDDRGGVATRDVLLGAGQKYGIYWAFNPATGGLFWSLNTGPASIEWGSAVDLDTGTRVFVANGNLGRLTWTPVGRAGQTAPFNGGTIGALQTGTATQAPKMTWQVPAPGLDLVATKTSASANAPVAFTNFVAFQGYSSGVMAAFEVDTGKRIWSYQTSGTIEGGPAIFNDTVFWGTGYSARGGVAGKKLYAFAIPH